MLCLVITDGIADEYQGRHNEGNAQLFQIPYPPITANCNPSPKQTAMENYLGRAAHLQQRIAQVEKV